MLNPVQGKVIYKDKPLKGVLVAFHPKSGADIKTENPVGLTGEDGSFTLTTGKAPGAREGEYVITFMCMEEVAPKGKKPPGLGMGVETQDRFQGAYANRDTSTTTVQIKKGDNKLEPFRLK